MNIHTPKQVEAIEAIERRLGGLTQTGVDACSAGIVEADQAINNMNTLMAEIAKIMQNRDGAKANYDNWSTFSAVAVEVSVSSSAAVEKTDKYAVGLRFAHRHLFVLFSFIGIVKPHLVKGDLELEAFKDIAERVGELLKAQCDEVNDGLQKLRVEAAGIKALTEVLQGALDTYKKTAQV